MCGITGIFGKEKSAEILRDQISIMCSALIHRGPDGWGRYVAPGIGLGHTRLSIVDLSAGSQPMATDRYVVVFNGEIYNHVEIRIELEKQGLLFKTHNSDTEVILKAFERYGSDCLSMFNGQFAFLLWDRQEKTLYAVRDRYGVRPLYMMKHRNCTYFASEMKSFDRIPGFKRTMKPSALFEHGLLWNTIGEETVFNEVASIPGGYYYVFKDGKEVEKNCFYQLGTDSKAYTGTYDNAKEEFYELLEDAVRLRLRSDVPVGAYLSGGVDSSVITRLVADINRKPFKTFSVAFEDAQYDERVYQQKMVDQLKCDHTQVSITYDSINDSFMDAVYHFERPVFRTAPVPLFLLSKKVRESGIKVVLTGEGADEVLFGYDSFKEQKLLDFWSRQPHSTLRPQLIKRLYPHLKHYADNDQYGMMRMYYEEFLGECDNILASVNIRINNNMAVKNYLNKDFAVSFDKNRLIEKMRAVLPVGYQEWTSLQRNQFMEMRTLLSGYLLSTQGDRMSLAHSVEGRYPFLDHRLVELAFSFPDSFKLKGFSQKHILRDRFKGMIPNEILNRPKLPYQAPDLKSFIRSGHLTEMAAEMLSEKMLVEYGIFNTKFVTRFLKKFETHSLEQLGYRDNMLMIFMLSSQIVNYWIHNPKAASLDSIEKTVDILEH